MLSEEGHLLSRVFMARICSRRESGSVGVWARVDFSSSPVFHEECEYLLIHGFPAEL